MADHLDVPLEDTSLMEEVELVSSLMIAASEADEHLDQGRIDELLGVERSGFLPEPRQPH